MTVTLIAASSNFSMAAFAAGPAAGDPQPARIAQSCGVTCDPAGQDGLTLHLPDGEPACQDSGPSATCATILGPGATAPGSVSTPPGAALCPTVPSKPVPAGRASCGDVVVASDLPTRRPAEDARASVRPSVPVDSLGSERPEVLELTSDADAVRAGVPAVLTATADQTVTDTELAIEIFDLTSGIVVAACPQGSQCSIAYTASGRREFAAFVTTPTRTIPNSDVSMRSNQMSVEWLDAGIKVTPAVAGPGQPITVTATSTFDVQGTGRRIEIFDLTTGSRVTYCSRGTECATTLKQSRGGVRRILGYVSGEPGVVSAPITLTWVKVSLSATSIGPKAGGTVRLKATVNIDLRNTPWAVAVYDANDELVGQACRTGTTCSVTAVMNGTSKPEYTAVIGALPSSTAARFDQFLPPVAQAGPQPLTDIQTTSRPVQPAQLLWGVDSCKALTGTPAGELFNSVAGKLGTPDFWGRYLTDTLCPGIGAKEVELARRHHTGILPIYNDFICSNVHSYDTGRTYADDAVAAAHRIGIPAGRGLAIDIEPPGAACPGAGSVDQGFIEGWFDGLHEAGFTPIFYGNGTAGSAFASAWCAAVGQRPGIATDSSLWSFEPSLLGSFSRGANPESGPHDPGCGGNLDAWQYVLSGGAMIDVDQDEAMPTLPLWYPA